MSNIRTLFELTEEDMKKEEEQYELKRLEPLEDD